MIAAALVAFGLTISPALAAADTPVHLTLDGRPISEKTDVAVLHDGELFIDAVDFTRVANGLLVFEGKGTVKLAVRGHAATFSAGTRTARIDGKSVTLAHAPFERHGDLYIPFAAILKQSPGTTLHVIDKTHADVHLAVFNTVDTPLASPAVALAVIPTASAAADGLHVSVTIRNTLDVPYTLTFPTSARATFLVDRDGTTVWDSSGGKRFLQSLGQVTLAPGEAQTYADVWPGWSAADPGRYQLRARLELRTPLISSPVSLGVK
ncbi:MAG: hypothetical protein JO359_08255 [Candidatus Eremiobacteraeota bacterium]|nr:hypothetical protein [Candidatus Eremiobacteraeota bacterium]